MTATTSRPRVQHWHGADAETRDRVVSKLRAAKRLPQSRDQWQFLVKRLRLWLTRADGRQVRPPCMLIIDLYPHGALRAHRFPENATTEAELPVVSEALEFILDEMLAPQREGVMSARPSSISFASQGLAEALALPLGYLLCDQVSGEAGSQETERYLTSKGANAWRPSVLVEAEGVREFMHRFAENLVAKGKGATSTASESPGLIQTLMSGGERRDGAAAHRYRLRSLSSPEAEAVVAHYYRLACLMYERKPWDTVSESWLFRVESVCDEQALVGPGPVALRMHTRFLVVLGGNAPGFVGLPSVRAARKRYAASIRQRIGASTKTGTAAQHNESDEPTTPLYTPSEVVASLSEDDIPDVVLCAHTGRVIPGPYAYRCSRCKRAYYVDSEAQKADWQRHAPECEAIANAKTSASESSILDARDLSLITRNFWRYAELVHLYMEESALCFDDLDAIEENGWPIAARSSNAWPVPFVTIGGGSLPRPLVERPNLEELSWMIALMEWILEQQGAEQLRAGMQMPPWRNNEIWPSGAEHERTRPHVRMVSIEPVEDMSRPKNTIDPEGAHTSAACSGSSPKETRSQLQTSTAPERATDG